MSALHTPTTDFTTSTERTLAAYSALAAVYVQRTGGVGMSKEREFFLRQLPNGLSGASVLDAGCGSGRDALEFKRLGLGVVAFDGCEEMARLAGLSSGQAVLHLRFDQVEWVEEFDGVWACASLLHLPDEDLADAVHRLARSLKAGGVLCAVMKKGEGTSVAADGRFFNYMSAERFAKVLDGAGLGQFQCVESESYLGVQDTVWLTMSARKPYF